MKRFFYAFALAALVAVTASCNKDNDKKLSLYSATVTFRPQSDGSYFLKQDAQTALIVTNRNWEKYPFKDGKEKRALIQYGVDKDNTGTNKVEGFKDVWDVVLFSLDTMQIKEPLAYEDGKDYGKSEIGLYVDDKIFPRTVVEDGYLNLVFEIPYGTGAVRHQINLLTGVNADDPYEVKVIHNAFDDININRVSGMMSFPLKSLSDTKGKLVPLTIKWDSMVSHKEESITLEYCTRYDW